MRELIDFDADTGAKLYLERDADGFSLREEHDVTPVIEANKIALNDGFDRSRDMWHAARVPIGIMFEWKEKFGIEFWNPNHKAGVMRLLNSNEYRYLRVNEFIL